MLKCLAPTLLYDPNKPNTLHLISSWKWFWLDHIIGLLYHLHTLRLEFSCSIVFIKGILISVCTKLIAKSLLSTQFFLIIIIIIKVLIYFLTELLPAQVGNRAEIVTESFLQDVFDILMDYIKKSNDRSNKILDFHHPDQLLDQIDLSLPDKPQNLDQILVDCKDALKYQVKTGGYKM